MRLQCRIQVANTDIDVFLDSNLHIMDKKMPGTMAVSKAMSINYLDEISSWLGEYDYNRIFVYYDDGAVTEWLNNEFQTLDYLEPELIIGFWST